MPSSMHQPISPPYSASVALALPAAKWLFPFSPEPMLTITRVWIIGHGHSRTVYNGMKITPAEAEQFLLDDLDLCEQFLLRELPTAIYQSLTRGELACMILLTFTQGQAHMRKLPLLRLLARGWKSQVPVSIRRTLPEAYYPTMLSLWQAD